MWLLFFFLQTLPTNLILLALLPPLFHIRRGKFMSNIFLSVFQGILGFLSSPLPLHLRGLCLGLRLRWFQLHLRSFGLRLPLRSPVLRIPLRLLRCLFLRVLILPCPFPYLPFLRLLPLLFLCLQPFPSFSWGSSSSSFLPLAPVAPFAPSLPSAPDSQLLLCLMLLHFPCGSSGLVCSEY